MLCIIKYLSKKNANMNRYSTRNRFAHNKFTRKIHYCCNVCFKVEGLNEPELLSSFENFFQSLKTSYFFWSYDSDRQIIIVNETNQFTYDDIIIQLNFILSWLSIKQCYIVGSFSYRTDKYMGLIYIPHETNIVNHIIIPIELISQDKIIQRCYERALLFTNHNNSTLDVIGYNQLNTIISNTDRQIRIFSESIGITNIPIFYI